MQITPSSVRLGCIVRLDMEDETQLIQNWKLSLRCKVWTLILTGLSHSLKWKMSWPRGSSSDDLLHVAERTSPSNPNVVMSPTSELHNSVLFPPKKKQMARCPEQRSKWHQQCGCSTITEVWTIQGCDPLHEEVGFLKCRISWHCMVLNMSSVGTFRDREAMENIEKCFVRHSCKHRAQFMPIMKRLLEQWVLIQIKVTNLALK